VRAPQAPPRRSVDPRNRTVRAALGFPAAVAAFRWRRISAGWRRALACARPSPLR
jgi:hypothetical protein